MGSPERGADARVVRGGGGSSTQQLHRVVAVKRTGGAGGRIPHRWGRLPERGRKEGWGTS
jgi:hypothetical protein